MQKGEKSTPDGVHPVCITLTTEHHPQWKMRAEISDANRSQGTVQLFRLRPQRPCHSLLISDDKKHRTLQLRHTKNTSCTDVDALYRAGFIVVGAPVQHGGEASICFEFYLNVQNAKQYMP